MIRVSFSTALHQHPAKLGSFFRVFLFSFMIGLICVPTGRAAESFDVVVYGGTSAGVASAVQVSRMGKTVVLIEPGKHLGGLSSGGLGWTDSGRKDMIGGVSREFYQRVKKHYDDPKSWPLQDRDTLNVKRGTGRYLPEADAMWVFEPHVAEAIFETFAKEQGIPVVRGERLNRETGVKKTDARILSITMESGREFSAPMFIDATYEGDLMAAAGVSYHVGREANDQYGEHLNGVQKTRMHGHLFIKKVDPYVVPGDPSSGLVARVHGDTPGNDHQGDHRVQAYNYRMCMTTDKRNRVPFPKPEGYDEKQYELLFRNFEAGDLRMPWSPGLMPNHKTDTNNLGAFSTDNIGMNYRYPEAGYAERAAILKEHEIYQKGLMWSLGNHPRIPQEIRDQMADWGLAADEFTDNGNWPHQIYVREARRMVGQYVTTENDCRRLRVAEDSVGLGSYNMDSHNTQRYVAEDGNVQDEGDIQESPGGVYVISYGSIVPKKAQCENLLVPAAVSSSHIAYGSIRMEPVFMILGQSAATAAVMAIDRKSAVQEVPYAELRKRLLADQQVLDLPPGSKPHRPLLSSSLAGIVADDRHAEMDGQWTFSRGASLYIDRGYHHDGNSKKGKRRVIFSTNLITAGRYEVRFSYPENSNRASNVPVTVHHRGEPTTVTVNQKENDGDDAGFVSLGTYEFAEGPTKVVVSNKGTNGHVVADAVQWLKGKE